MTYTLRSVIREEVDPTARVMTATLSSYHGLGDESPHNETVNHSTGEYARCNARVNVAASFFSLFKWGVLGRFQYDFYKHFHCFTAELAFCWTHRKAENGGRRANAAEDVPRNHHCYRARRGAHFTVQA